MTTSGSQRTFADARPSVGSIRVAMLQQARGNQKFQQLPPPTGAAPYRLSLDAILGADTVNAIRQAGQMTFHTAGDTGGVKQPVPQQIVANHLEEQLTGAPGAAPAFFYHLGDVVYFYGAASEYFAQFYEPYDHYTAPILAIPGNHDGDLQDDTVASLQAFVDNFCAADPHVTPDAGESSRDAMTQPNCYWTLQTPFATIVGLYTNVPEGGEVRDDQRAWFVNELREAAADQALIVAMHHPPYSADNHHSGSQAMIDLIDGAAQEAGRMPDMVLTGHVHNYQRFTRLADGRDVPFIVAGGGGYWNLHKMAKGPDGQAVQTPAREPELGVTLDSYCDDRHGFLKLTVSAAAIHGEYYAVPRPHESWSAPAEMVDGFTLDLAQHRMVADQMAAPAVAAVDMRLHGLAPVAP